MRMICPSDMGLSPNPEVSMARTISLLELGSKGFTTNWVASAMVIEASSRKSVCEP